MDGSGAGTARSRMRVAGVVQGVGFRPFVFRLAAELGLAGWVLNDERGVLLEVEGPPRAIAELATRLETEAPPLAAIQAVVRDEAPVIGESGFRIVASPAGGEAQALVAPDTATCAECLAEVMDPADRRYRYPFANCTNCGPRFTIVRGVPYDRPLTTMAGFEMCPACLAEYEDPGNRRFHAQPNACPACGPTARIIGAKQPADGQDAVGHAAALIGEGAILAIKGLGGYHLACLADAEGAVSSLRSRKRREDKPLALMAADLASAEALVELSDDDRALLKRPERPIVIARRAAGARVAKAVAPHSLDLGVMLPYTPLHHLLLADVGTPLVMTSANVSDEPIAYLDDEALQRLRGIADAFLVHDRPIHMRTDDSVVRSTGANRRVLLRRSRGYVPGSLTLPEPAPAPVLGCGAELKSTFCLAKGDRAWVGHHIGDLKNWETLAAFREGVAHFERLFAVSPRVVAHDLHPDYLSTRYALERDGVETVAVQHHHAHLAACLAEHGEDRPAVGVIFDGTGFGTDGTVWGGELLRGGLASFERAGMLMPVRLPGGDSAVREPWRMAASWLAHATGEEVPATPRSLAADAGDDWEAVCGLVSSGAGSPLTTSVGRLFDAVAALCGVRARVNYEGQAAAELEGAADPLERGAYPIALEGGDGAPLVIDPRSAIRGLAADVAASVSVAVLAARFHNGLADVTAAACARECERSGVELAVLSGGVFQNRLLLERTLARLEERGLRTLVPERLPPNDGGIAYGQVAVAIARRRNDEPSSRA